MKKLSRKMVALALVLSLFGVTSSACFGKFALTRKVYEWNDKVSESKFVKSLVMWVLYIIPVYGVSLCLDVVIFNLLEVFTGNNPMASAEDGSVVVQQGANKAVISRAGDKIYIDFYENGVYAGYSEIYLEGKGIVRGTVNLAGEESWQVANVNGVISLQGRDFQESYTVAEINSMLEEASLPVRPAFLH